MCKRWKMTSQIRIWLGCTSQAQKGVNQPSALNRLNSQSSDDASAGHAQVEKSLGPKILLSFLLNWTILTLVSEARNVASNSTDARPAMSFSCAQKSLNTFVNSFQWKLSRTGESSRDDWCCALKHRPNIASSPCHPPWSATSATSRFAAKGLSGLYREVDQPVHHVADGFVCRVTFILFRNWLQHAPLLIHLVFCRALHCIVKNQTFTLRFLVGIKGSICMTVRAVVSQSGNHKCMVNFLQLITGHMDFSWSNLMAFY